MLFGPAQSALGLGQIRHGKSWLAMFYQVLVAGGFILSWLALIVGGWLVVKYLYTYAPALKRARFDVQSAMMLELQQQVEQLRRDLEQRDR